MIIRISYFSTLPRVFLRLPMHNLALLTQSHQAIAAKKRAKRDQIKEVIFDDNARRSIPVPIAAGPV